MKENKHRHIDLLKFDIEHAEYKVIKDLLDSKVQVGVLYIEIHYENDVINIWDYFKICNSIETLGRTGNSNALEINNRHFAIVNKNNFKLAA